MRKLALASYCMTCIPRIPPRIPVSLLVSLPRSMPRISNASDPCNADTRITGRSCSARSSARRATRSGSHGSSTSSTWSCCSRSPSSCRISCSWIRPYMKLRRRSIRWVAPLIRITPRIPRLAFHASHSTPRIPRLASTPHIHASHPRLASMPRIHALHHPLASCFASLHYTMQLHTGQALQGFLQAQAAFRSPCEHQHTAHGADARVRLKGLACLASLPYQALHTSHLTPRISRLASHVIHSADCSIHRYWCYSFEGMHQRVKKIAANSNYRNVSKRIVFYHSLQFGLRMYRRRRRH